MIYQGWQTPHANSYLWEAIALIGALYILYWGVRALVRKGKVDAE